MKHLVDWEPLICSVDPITLTGLVLAGGLGAAGASLAGGGGSAAPAPAPPPTMAPPQSGPTGTKPQTQSQQPSFVGASAVPNNSSGQKTLLGQ
jgi:hypothetical protein